MRRRAFVRDTIVGAGVAAGLPAIGNQALAAAKKTAALKLCSQAGRVPGKSFAEKIKRLEEWGALGVELGGNPRNQIKDIKSVLADTKIRVSAQCWGSAGGKLVSLDMEKRQKGIDELKSALETAGQLEAQGVIFVPCFHKQSDLKPEELDKVMLEILPGLAEFAAQHKTRVLIEPLRKGETFYINRLEQAVRFCKEIDSPGLALMGDFYHMTREEKDERQAFIGAGDYLRHVHIASRKSRKLPGTDEDSYVEGLRGLKAIGYQQYISLECGVKKGQKPEEGIPACFRMLEKQWEQATV